MAEKTDAYKALYNDLQGTVELVDGKPSIVGDPFRKALSPEEYEFEERIQDKKKLFYPVMAEVAGEKMIEAMDNDSGLNQTTLEVPLTGKDHFDLTMNRSRIYRNPQDEDQPITKWGQIEAQLVTQAVRNNRGEMSAVRDRLSAMAMEKLCK